MQSLPDIRIVVSDNASTDGTWSIVNRYRDDKRVVLVKRDNGLDIVEHFNKCLELVNSKYFMVLCHDDCLASKTAIEWAYRILEGDAALNAVYCDMKFIDRTGAHVMTRRFRPSGPYELSTVAHWSIIATRNGFGIPLLMRFHGQRYDRALPYVADIDMAIQNGRTGAPYHIAEPLIANRFHQNNITHGLLSRVYQQMLIIKNKHSISLSVMDRARMVLNAFLIGLARRLFFIFLDIRSKYGRSSHVNN